MSKMNELSMILDEMITCGNNMVKTAESLKKYFSSTEEEPLAAATKTDMKDETKEKKYTKEEVRALLAQKANTNKAGVKALVKKFADSGLFKDIDATYYKDVVAELEAMPNV